MRKIIISIIIIAALSGLVFFALRNRAAAEDQSGIPRDAYPVELAVAGTDTLINKVSVKGVVEMIERTSVFPKTDARVAEVFIKAGDTVNAGDLLLTYQDEVLDTYRNQMDDLNLQLKAAKLRLNDLSLPSAEMDILTAERAVAASKKDIEDLNRRLEQADNLIQKLKDEELAAAIEKRDAAAILFDAGIIAKNDFETFNDAIAKIENEIKTRTDDRNTLALTMSTLEEALDYNTKRYESVLEKTGESEETVKSQMEQSLVAIEQIELKISQLNKQIDEFVYEETAPVSGTVLAINAKEGGMVSRATPLAEIADTGNANLRITVNVPEAEASEIVLGQEAEVSGGVLGKDIIAGRVTKIRPIAETKQLGNSMETVIIIELSFDDASGRLRSGNSVDIDIIVNIYEDVTVVPLMATFSEAGGGEFVYVMNDDYTISKREVTLLAFSGMNIGVIGVNAGERIVATPSAQIKDGSYVKPVVRNIGG